MIFRLINFAATLTQAASPDRNDHTWVSAIAKGSPQAENELLRFFDSRIERILMQKLGKISEDLLDLKQDIQIALIKSLRNGKCDLTKGKLGSYVYGLVSHKVIDYLKSPKRTRHVPLNPEIEIPDTYTPDRDIEKQERLNRLRAQLKKLPEKYKTVLYKRYFLDHSISEISEALKLPARRVSERINYAKKLLKNVYAG